MTGQPAAPASLAEALAALQAQMPRVAKTNPGQSGQGRYLYADLTDCTDALYPLMGPLGLSFTARPTMSGDRFVLAYKLLHSPSGEHEAGEYPLPANASPQGQGAAITYARRYSLCAVTGLAPGGDDDDGQQASSQQAPEPARKPRNVPDAQLAAEGRMTRAQKTAHERLEAGTKRGNGTKADRVRPSEPDPGDPWAADQPITHYRAREIRNHLDREHQPEDRPGSIMPGQHRAIEAQLSMLGFKREERADRHGHACLRLGLDTLPPRPDAPDGGPSLLGLSAAQAAELIRALQDDLDDLKKADAADA